MRKMSMVTSRRGIRLLAMSMSMMAVAACAGDGAVTGSGENGATMRPAGPAIPVGVYAKIDYDSFYKYVGSPPNSDLYGVLYNNYIHLLQDPAVSGIWLGIHWSDFYRDTTNQQTLYFTPVNALAAAVSFVNSGNINPPRTFVLSVMPGTHSPQWLFNGLRTCTCQVDPCCGAVDWQNYREFKGTGPSPVPTPWALNATDCQDASSPLSYPVEWANFLQSLNTALSPQPTSLVGIAIGGPTGPSTEMILPNGLSSNDVTDTACANPLTPQHVWDELADGDAPDSGVGNTLMIHAWRDTFTTYQTNFPNIAKILVPDNGEGMPLLDLNPLSVNARTLKDTMCLKSITGDPGNVSCKTTVQIMADFLALQDSLGMQVSGMKAASSNSNANSDSGTNIGLPGLKYLAQPPSGSQWTPPAVGAEFDLSITDGTIAPCYANMQFMGCPPGQPNCSMTPEIAFYNVLTTFFAGMPGAPDFSPDATFGQVPLSYLTVGYQDILYSEVASDICGGPMALGQMSMASARYVLQLANYYLLTSNGKTATLPTMPSCTGTRPTCPSGESCNGAVCQ